MLVIEQRKGEAWQLQLLAPHCPQVGLPSAIQTDRADSLPPDLTSMIPRSESSAQRAKATLRISPQDSRIHTENISIQPFIQPEKHTLDRPLPYRKFVDSLREEFRQTVVLLVKELRKRRDPSRLLMTGKRTNDTIYHNLESSAKFRV